MKRDISYFLNKTIEVNSCLEWQGCYNTDGYPRIHWNGSANGKLHRVVWELHTNKSAKGLIVRHTCDNPRCINPEHLDIGTSLDNVNDRTQRDRSQGLKQRDVETIKSLFSNKTYSAKELAAMFGVSNRTIYYTLNER